MNHTREEVMAAAQSRFSSQPMATIIEILDLYGAEPHEGERERVQLAILKLSEGDVNKLLHFVEAAKQDYRDVLFWTDHPEESGHDASLTAQNKFVTEIRDYCEALGIEIPSGFYRHAASRYAAIDTGVLPPKLIAKTWFNQEDVVYYLKTMTAGRQVRVLDFKDRQELILEGGERLKRGSHF